MRLSGLTRLMLAVSLSMIAGFVACIDSPRAAAQGIITGGITGSVVDQTGAVIPNATITATNDSTGTSMQAKSNAEGIYLITNVPIGSYTVSFSATGFAPGRVNHVTVVAGNATQVGKQAMGLGAAAAQTVEVEAGAAQVMNTESAQGELVVDSAQLASIPVNGAMDNVTLVVPGVVQTHSDGMSNTNGVNFSVNGERGRSNNSEIDGQSNNDNMVAGPSFFFSNQDAIQELQIITNDFSAEYGRNMGSVVNYITKSGTNTFHGTGFEYYTGSFLSSLLGSQKDPQYGATGIVPRFVENNWGGTLGGPILKDRLWGFGSTFWVHEYLAGALDSSNGAVFPDSNGLQTLTSAFPDNPAVTELTMFGPQANKNGNPAFFGAPVSIPVTDGTTTANVEAEQFSRNLAATILDQEHLGRLDYQATTSDRFYLRYIYQNNPFLPAYYLYGSESIAQGGYANVNGITHEIGGDWTHTFTPATVNQVRYAFQQSTIGFFGGTIPNCTLSNFGPCSSTVTMGNDNGANLGTIGYGGAFPQGRVIKVNQLQDNASWSRGRHTIQFGGEFDHQDSPASGLPNAPGSFNFDPAFVLKPLRFPSSISSANQTPYMNGLTGILEGVAFVSLTNGKTFTPFKEPDYALYVQDNWKVLPNFTLNLGVRYEFFGQSVNELHSLSVAQQTGSNPFWSTTLPLAATTYPSIKSDYRNFEPRIGIAYTPDFAKKMVIHAGFAINVDPAFYNIFLNSAQSAPLVNAGNFYCNGTTVQCEPSGGFTYSTVQAQDLPFIPTGGDPRTNPINIVPNNFKNPMAETYTLGVQYEVMPSAVAEVRYVGNHTFGQFQSLNTNPNISAAQAAFPGYGSTVSPCSTAAGPAPTNPLQPNCNYGEVDTVANTAFSVYNSLQTSLTVRNFHHWTGTASYTYSRAIDNVSEIFSTGGGGTTNAFAQDALNTNLGERGVSGNSYPSVWGIQMEYTTPWFTNQAGILGRALGGFFMNAFYQYNGGQPFTPTQGFTPGSPFLPTMTSAEAALATTNFCDTNFAATFVGISQCRPILANKAAPMNSVGINVNGTYYNYSTGATGSRDSFHWLWNNEYEAIALGNPFPGVGRNTLRGDPFSNLDLTVGKRIKVTERVNMLLQAAAFNVMNRAYYGTPDNNLEDSDLTQYGLPNTFLTNYFAGGNQGSAAAGGAYFQGVGNRNVQLGAKINF